MNVLSQPVAVIDVGSNSIKLLVARTSGEGIMEVLASPTLETRISRGISGVPPSLDAESMQRGVEAIAKLVTIARKHSAGRIEIVATSAVRDAANGTVFAESVTEVTGIPLRILTGVEEARGVGRGILLDPIVKGSSAAQVIDLGGGSLEYLLFREGNPLQIESYPLGSVRLTEMAIRVGVHHDAALLSEWVHDTTRKSMRQTPVCRLLDRPSAGPLFGAGGSLFTVHQLATKTGQISGSSLGRDLLWKLYLECHALPVEERAALPGVQAGRADILPTALATLHTITLLGDQSEISLCPFNLRFGLAAELLGATEVHQLWAGQ